MGSEGEVTTFTRKYQLGSTQATLNPSAEELSKVILERIGLEPRKSGSTDKMHRLLLEFYERSKAAHRSKRPEESVMTVEEMGYFAGITRQTMYDYLKRWLALHVIVKTTYITNNTVVIGYKLNGSTLEQAFEKAAVQIQQNLALTMKYVTELQRIIKNEKISDAAKARVEGQTILETGQETTVNA